MYLLVIYVKILLFSLFRYILLGQGNIVLFYFCIVYSAFYTISTYLVTVE